jgi:hypothetical protein
MSGCDVDKKRKWRFSGSSDHLLAVNSAAMTKNDPFWRFLNFYSCSRVHIYGNGKTTKGVFAQIVKICGHIKTALMTKTASCREIDTAPGVTEQIC